MGSFNRVGFHFGASGAEPITHSVSFESHCRVA